MSRLILLILFITPTAMAHDSDEVLTLKAANDALTMRVAELLAENKRLEEFARNAMIAQTSNTRVSIGCDPNQLRKIATVDQAPPSEIEGWLKSNWQNCKAEQLGFIVNNLSSWTSYLVGDEIRLARYYRDQKN